MNKNFFNLGSSFWSVNEWIFFTPLFIRLNSWCFKIHSIQNSRKRPFFFWFEMKIFCFDCGPAIFFVPDTNRVKIFWRVFWVFVCYSSNYCFLTWLNGCLELSSNVEKPQMPTEAAELLTKGEASLVFCSIYIGDIKYFCYIWLLTTNTGFKT